jgi:methylmalonyl-CoA mutase
MEAMEPHWAQFSPMDTERWRALILKELKGGAPGTLDWEVEPDLSGQPFYHAPDKDFGGPLRLDRDPDWLILETIPVGGDTPRANRLALESLAFGAQSLHFSGASPTDLPSLLEGIHLEMVPVFWSNAGSGASDAICRAFTALSGADAAEAGRARIRGGWLLATAPTDWPDTAVFPSDWVLGLPPAGPSNIPSNQLGSLLAMAHRAITEGHPPDRLMARFRIGPDYLTEIARLRAWRILWAHLMRSWGLDEATPTLIMATVEADPSLPWEDSFIAATSMALSAVLGGADHLSVLAPAHEQEGRLRRIARNIQHLMKEESHLHRVSDPMGGSYALEYLTLALAEKTWSSFLP